MSKEDLFDRIAGIFFRYPCVLCNDYPKDNALLCDKCTWTRLDRLDLHYTGRCTDAVAAMAYEGKAKEAMLRFKREGDKRTERFFAEQMYAVVQRCWADVPFDFVIPVPMSALKQFRRGFNQAALLARRLARELDIPLETDVLMQREHMLTQHRLDVAARLDNARRFYAVAHGNTVSGRTILLVDDLITTGATAEICAGLLMDAGAKAVYALAAQSPLKPEFGSTL